MELFNSDQGSCNLTAVPPEPLSERVKRAIQNIKAVQLFTYNFFSQTFLVFITFVCKIPLDLVTFLCKTEEKESQIRSNTSRKTNSWTNSLLECCGGLKEYEAKLGLLLLTADMLMDIYTGVNHFVQGRTTAGWLTFAIIILSGMVVTTILHISIIRKANYTSEAKMQRSVWRILLRVPCLTPFISNMLRLKFVKELNTLDGEAENEHKRRKVNERFQDFEIGASWDSMFEGIYEAFPQALLQIVILMEKQDIVLTDTISMVGIGTSLIGIAIGPLNLVKVCEEAEDLGFVNILLAFCSKGVMLFCFSFSIISWRLLLPNNLILATCIGVLLIILLIDIPFVLIDGWIGRYPPAMKKLDEDSGDLENLKLKNYRKKILSWVYIIVDLIYVFVAVASLIFWIFTDMKFWGWSQHHKRETVIAGLYIIFLVAVLGTFISKRDRQLVGKCFPYFLGMFIVRLIRAYHKKMENLEYFGNGDYIHDYIGT